MAKPRMSFEEACRRYVHRFTMDYVPSWSQSTVNATGKYYAPQYRSDAEWYQNTVFPPHSILKNDCYSSGQTWPLGQWLTAPYKKEA